MPVGNQWRMTVNRRQIVEPQQGQARPHRQMCQERESTREQREAGLLCCLENVTSQWGQMLEDGKHPETEIGKQHRADVCSRQHCSSSNDPYV